MTEPREPESDQALAFLRDLVDRYGVEGLQDRLGAAIAEAEAGRVAGPALDEASAWLEEEQGARIASFAGQAMFTLSASAAGVMAAGTAHISLTGGISAESVVHNVVVHDVMTSTDQATIAVTEVAQVVATSVLPSNMQVLVLVHEVFWYLVEIWGLMSVPIEVVPFVLLMTLAIVVVRIRLKQP